MMRIRLQPLLLSSLLLLPLAALGAPCDPNTWAQINVQLKNASQVLTLHMDLDETIRSLVIKVCDLERLFWDWKVVKLGDTRLELDETLAHYNLRSGATLSLERLLPGTEGYPSEYGNGRDAKSVELRLLPQLGRAQEAASQRRLQQPLNVTTRLSVSVAKFKDSVAQLTGEPRDRLRLLLMGRELDDCRKLSDYHLGYGSQLTLGEPLESCAGPAEVRVETLSGASLRVRVDLADTVGELKGAIERRTGAPRHLQYLALGSIDLSDRNLLCDHGIEQGSRLRLVFNAPNLRDEHAVSALVLALQSASVARRVHAGPIFREAEEAAEEATRALHADPRNWSFHQPLRCLPQAWITPAVHATRHSSDKLSREAISTTPSFYRNGTLFELNRVIRALNLISAILSLQGNSSQGFRMGAGRRSDLALSHDINNYAPDAFSDAGIVRLFELAERVRAQLAHDDATGEGNLGLAKQREINMNVPGAYRDAIAGVPLAEELSKGGGGDDDVSGGANGGECGICHDELSAEPALELSCRHVMHTSCTVAWALQLLQGSPFSVPKCPFCRHLFRVAFEKGEWTW